MGADTCLARGCALRHRYRLHRPQHPVPTDPPSGLVRAPLFTTLIQVASRLLLVHPVLAAHPSVTASAAVSSMYLAWALTEVIRYSYFAQNLRGTPPDALVWLRYNTFFLLYPLGITSECVLIWNASVVDHRQWATLTMWAVLAAYVPGAYVLFSHMMAQRRRIRKGKAVVGKSRRARVPTI